MPTTMARARPLDDASNAARSALRHNPVMKAFYQTLVHENRRPGKVALTAVMRKMLVTLNAIAREQQPWRHAKA